MKQMNRLRKLLLVNADDGRFSFPIAGSQFRLDSVKKQGYQMVDVEACTRTYKLSSNPFRKNLQKQHCLLRIISPITTRRWNTTTRRWKSICPFLARIILSLSK